MDSYPSGQFSNFSNPLKDLLRWRGVEQINFDFCSRKPLLQKQPLEKVAFPIDHILTNMFPLFSMSLKGMMVKTFLSTLAFTG